MDTQWPRWIVFHQQQPGKPHQYAGSVHAPDSELALQNARDVFVRRPECSNLWVVPASKVFTKTLEELTKNPQWADVLPVSPAPVEAYYAFQKLAQAGSVVYVGEVQARTAEHAIVKALETFRNVKALWTWVVPVSAVIQTQEEDAPAMFAPAFDKTPFRDQSNFHTITLLKKLRAERSGNSQADDQEESADGS